jgi:hypothetical protein
MATAAAVLMVTAGVASAQQGSMKAEVPFAFSVGNNVVEAGTIQVRLLHSGSTAVIVSNYNAKSNYIVLAKSAGDAPKTWIASGEAKLGFDCTEGACILVRAWSGEGKSYEFRGPKTRRGEVLLTEIVMKPDRGD